MEEPVKTSTNFGMIGLRHRVVQFQCRLAGYVGVDVEAAAVIVANLPYIPSEALPTLPVSVRDYEPRAALDGFAER